MSSIPKARADAGSQAHLKTAGEQFEFANKASITGANQINPNVTETFQALKLRRKHAWMILKIGDEDVYVEETGARNSTFADLKSKLPFTDCRFAIFDQEIKTADGRITNKLWFISWFPSAAHPYNQMSYASAKTRVRETLPGVFDVQATNVDDLEISLGLKKEEVEDDDDDF